MEVPADCIESVEKSIRGTGACLQPYVDEQENLKDKVDILTENLEKVRQDNLKLVEEIAGLKAQKIDLMNRNHTAIKRINNKLEEEIAGLKAQKIDLVNHLRTAIKRMNNIRQWIRDNFPESVNDRYHEELDFGSISDNE